MKLKSPTPQQTFLIVSMLFGETREEREPKLSDSIVKALKPVAFRKQLVDSGLIRIEKRGRIGHVLLDDAAWDFAAEHLAAELPRTPSAGKVLQRVLGKVQRLLQAHEHSLAEFVDGGLSRDSAETTEHAVRAACLALAHNETRKRIRLKDLRERVPASRESLDRILQAMQVTGKLILFRLDNPAEISSEDERAALFIGGEPRHLVYLEA